MAGGGSRVDSIVQMALMQALQGAQRHHQAGRVGQAEALCRQMIQQVPQFAEAWQMLGALLAERGRMDEALAALQRAVELKPEFAEAHSNLGNILINKGRVEEGLAECQRAITLKPDLAMAYNALATGCKLQGRSDEAIAAYRQALALGPNVPQFHTNLAVALEDQGRLAEALGSYRRAVELDPRHPGYHSNLVYALHFTDASPAALAAELRCWNQRHAEPLRQQIRPHTASRDAAEWRQPERRLRIGYVSPDFFHHAQSQFTLPLLTQHDRSQMEVFAYADVVRPDALTERLRALCDGWRNIVGQPDEHVADMVRADKIDILVDLTLHMARNRLLVFARKPAPVQVTWLGYPASTGLTAIDYRISDPYLDPPGADESVFSEKVFRLPESFWCYDPLDERDVPVNDLPALTRGTITFGCLNNFCKVHEKLLRLWAGILRQVEGSRLMLLTPEGSHRQAVREVFVAEGVAAERIEFHPRQSRRDYLKLYLQMDVGLDSLPCNGHTTSLDSFWMGVPVVTTIGKTAMGRGTWCQLSNLGLESLAGKSEEEYAQIAVDLAHDLARLAELRRTLRDRLAASPLMDRPRFARNMEAAYRAMWRTWCAGA